MSSSSSVGLRRLTCRKSRASGHLVGEVVADVTDHQRARLLVAIPVHAEVIGGRPGADLGVVGELDGPAAMDPGAFVRMQPAPAAGGITQLGASEPEK